MSAPPHARQEYTNRRQMVKECKVDNNNCDYMERDYKKCHHHLKLNRESEARRRKKLADEGKCTNCRKTNDTTNEHCTTCKSNDAERSKALRQKKADAGLCGRCSKPKGELAYCQNCTEYYSLKVAQHRIARDAYIIANNLCRVCGEAQRVRGSARCAKCARWSVTQIYGEEDPDRITCSDASEILNVSRQRIHQLVERGRIDVCATRPKVLVTRKSVLIYARNRKK